MDQPIPAGTQFTSPVAIIDPQYCVPYNADLAVVKEVLKLSSGNFVVTDIKDKIVFKVDSKSTILGVRDCRVIRDADGKPIVTLREKLLTAHDRWKAFRGESTESSDLVFSVKRSSVVQMNTKLHVFLANNTDEDSWDYTVEGSGQSCTIYAGDSSTSIAQMRMKKTFRSVVFGKDHFMVTVYPNIDYAFIVALIVILDEIKTDLMGTIKLASGGFRIARLAF